MVSEQPAPTGAHSVKARPAPIGAHSAKVRPAPIGALSPKGQPAPIGVHSVKEQPAPIGAYSSWNYAVHFPRTNHAPAGACGDEVQLPFLGTHGSARIHCGEFSVH